MKTTDVETILDWCNTSKKDQEIPFKAARVILQDFTGVPAVVDLVCLCKRFFDYKRLFVYVRVCLIIRGCLVEKCFLIMFV